MISWFLVLLSVKSEISEVVDSIRRAWPGTGPKVAKFVLEEAYRHHIFNSPSLTAQDGDREGVAPVPIIEMAATGMP